MRDGGASDLSKCERACLLALEYTRLTADRSATIAEVMRLTGYDRAEVEQACERLSQLGFCDMQRKGGTPSSSAVLCARDRSFGASRVEHLEPVCVGFASISRDVKRLSDGDFEEVLLSSMVSSMVETPDDERACQGTRCKSLGHVPTPMAHPCPYNKEIRNDDEAFCTCCEICERECLRDI